jgi:hypothetical protein
MTKKTHEHEACDLHFLFPLPLRCEIFVYLIYDKGAG